MAFLIELDEGTAARRRVPFKLFTSNGTSPDTGASGDSLMFSVNGGAQSDLTTSVISANAGMYFAEFATADVGTLGTIAMWHDVGSFVQHVANVNVVNFNPMSTQSALALGDLSIGTVSNLANASVGTVVHLDNQSVGTVDNSIPSSATIAGVVNVSTEIAALNNIDGSGVTLHVGVHSSATIQGVELVDVTTTNSDMRGTDGVDTTTMRGTDNAALATGVNLIADQTAASIGTVSNLGNHSVGTVDNGIPSDATIAGVTNVSVEIAALNDIDGSEVTIHAGGIQTTSYAAGARDAAGQATDAVQEIADGILDRDMSTGADSGSSAVRTPRDALRSLRNRVDLSGNTLTVFDEDDTTVAWTASLTTTGDSAFPTAMDPNS